MVTINALNALRETVQRVTDIELKNELLGRITDIQHILASRQNQLEAGRAHVPGIAPRETPPLVIVYDPPV